jgi:hypothetical protein|tara:strand:- start:390 stop:1022 length:633 start_codon:yes stop_codon:yes gene_type:complete
MEHPDPVVISTFFNVSKTGRFTTPELNLHNGGKIRTWFPLSIYECGTVDWKKIPDYQKELIKPNINIFTSSLFDSLRVNILNHSKEFLKQLGYNNNFCESSYIKNMTYKITHKGHTEKCHTHSGSLLTGEYYLKSHPKDKLRFYPHENMKPLAHSVNELSYEYATYECRIGTMLFFKGTTIHQNLPQQEEEKITIKFDVVSDSILNKINE